MNLQTVLERFSLIANVETDESSPWIPICQESIDEILAHIKPGINIEENSRRLEVAAASLALYKYALYRASNTAMESFTAGEIRVKTDPNTAVKMAYRAWREAKSSIAELLEDNDFVFERIVF